MSLPIKLELPSSFLLPEDRCGYQICEKQKKIWAVELDLLSEFSSVCKRHDIKWSVAFGTMIGAVRHKGFIPWDDDFDIMLERGEFEKLLAVATEFKAPYFLQYALSDKKAFTPLARLRNSKTTGYVTGAPQDGYNNGIYLDLYCFDSNPQSRFKYLLKFFLKRIIGKLLGLYCQENPKDGSLPQRVLWLLRPVVRMCSFEALWRLYCWSFALYNDSEPHFSHMLTAQRAGRKDWINRTDLLDTVMVPYEFTEVPIVRSYDGYLRAMYGDYLEYPPEEVRGKWHEGLIHFEPEMPYEEYFNRR